MKNEKDVLENLKAKIGSMVCVDDNDLEAIVNQFECREIARKEFLLKEGERCDFWGFVDTGLVRSYTYTDTGEEYTNGCIRENGFITESLSFFARSKSLVNVVALEDTQLVYITHAKLQKLYKDFPVFEKFARILYEERLAGMKAGILYLVQLDAKSRYLHFVKTQPELLKRVPLKYIASYLNITDSTLSRIRRKTLHLQT